MAYPGGKGSVFQKLINLMPPHDVYIEAFLGGGSVMLNKRPAAVNIGIDADAGVIAGWNERRLDNKLQLINGDGISVLKNFAWKGNELVYCDPPYLMSTRRSGKLYNHEMTDEQHRDLLSVITAIPARVMISGYWSELYTETLKDWHVITFEAMTRGGSMATEYVWMNYPAPVELHDYRYLGENFRERERIKRKKMRWIKKLLNMPILEQQALMAVLKEIGQDDLDMGKAISAAHCRMNGSRCHEDIPSLKTARVDRSNEALEGAEDDLEIFQGETHEQEDRISSPWAELPEELLTRMREIVDLDGENVAIVFDGETVRISNYGNGHWYITSHTRDGVAHVGSCMPAGKLRRLLERWVKKSERRSLQKKNRRRL